MSGVPKRAASAVLAVLGCSTLALATPYWFRWDGTDWPENQPGWYRLWGNYDGGGQGQSNRTLANGTLTFDNAHDVGLYDYVHRDFHGDLNPDPSEVFIAKWRTRVDALVGWSVYDPGVGIFGDDGWGVGIGMGYDRVIRGVGLPATIAYYEPGVYHSFELRTWDMRTFTLLLDGVQVYSGAMTHPTTSGYVAWGDGVMGAGSITAWDYVEIGVRTGLPEPTAVAIAFLLGGLGARRTR
jgi:hypothetical protein